MDNRRDNIYIYLWEEFNTVYIGRTVNPKAYRESHKEERLSYMREYHNAHREEERAKRRKYYALNGK